jgi:hypothetical protein
VALLYLTLVSFNRSARAGAGGGHRGGHRGGTGGGTGGAPCARWRAGSWRSAWGLGGKGGAPLHLAAGGGLGGAALKKHCAAAYKVVALALVLSPLVLLRDRPRAVVSMIL